MAGNQQTLAAYDPGNEYAVNYMWGTTGIGYNVKKVREIARPDAKIDSWDIVFKPENLAKFKNLRRRHARCAGRHPVGGAVLSETRSEFDQGPADLEKAAALVTAVRPSVRKFHSSEYLNALASGEICMVVGWSGDIKQAQKRAAEAKGGVEIGYVIPKEGAQMWFDNLAIPKDARHVEEALAFINFLQLPQIAARNTDFIAYPNGNLASQKFIGKAILDDKTIYPDATTMRGLYTITARDARTQRLINRLWTRIKTGR